jgi:hypothetical protein
VNRRIEPLKQSKTLLHSASVYNDKPAAANPPRDGIALRHKRSKHSVASR